MSNWLKNMPAMSGVAVMICFFLPWVLVSCSGGGGIRLEASGYEIATGNYGELRGLSELGSLFGQADPPPAQQGAQPALWLIPLVGALGLASLSGDRSGLQAALAGGVLGMAGMIVFTFRALSTGEDISLAGFQLQFQSGYWLTWGAFIVQSVSAIAAMQSEPGKRSAPSPSLGASRDSPLVGEGSGPPKPRAASRVLGTLEFSSGPLAGSTIPLHEEDVMIGRSSRCDVQLKDPSVSREHARLRYAEGAWFIQDQGSSGGIVVNGERVQASRLSAMDVVSISDSTFHLTGV